MAIAACVIGPLSDAASFQKISGLSSESATRAKRALTYGDISTAPSIGLPTSRANGDGGAHTLYTHRTSQHRWDAPRVRLRHPTVPPCGANS